MTLRKLLDKEDIRRNHPDVLANFEIENISEQCRIALLRYLQSVEFYDDIDSMILDLQELLDHGYESFSLRFENKAGKIHLKLVPGPAVDSIDSYQ